MSDAEWKAAFWHIRHKILKAYIELQQETTSMAADTLDGMTIAQLRDLAKRAEATAVQKEKAEQATLYIDTGVDGYKVRKRDGAIFAPSNRGPYYPEASKLLIDASNNHADLEIAGRIILAVAPLKTRGGFK